MYDGNSAMEVLLQWPSTDLSKVQPKLPIVVSQKYLHPKLMAKITNTKSILLVYTYLNIVPKQSNIYHNPGSLDFFPHEHRKQHGVDPFFHWLQGVLPWMAATSHHGFIPGPQTRRVGSPVMEPIVKNACGEWSGNWLSIQAIVKQRVKWVILSCFSLFVPALHIFASLMFFIFQITCQELHIFTAKLLSFVHLSRRPPPDATNHHLQP